MKKQIELFLLELLKEGYNIRWVQGLEREKNEKAVIKMYDTQTDETLGTIEVTEPYQEEIGDLVRAVKYPLLDPETLEKHLEGMAKVDVRYNKYLEKFYRGEGVTAQDITEAVVSMGNDAINIVHKPSEEESEYEQQAREFLDKTKTKLTLKFKRFGTMGHWKDDTKRNIWEFTLSNAKGSYTAEYGDSVVNSQQVVKEIDIQKDRELYLGVQIKTMGFYFSTTIHTDTKSIKNLEYTQKQQEQVAKAIEDAIKEHITKKIEATSKYYPKYQREDDRKKLLRSVSPDMAGRLIKNRLKSAKEELENKEAYHPDKQAEEVKSPGAYDILACMSPMYAETFEEFCGEFGYDEDSRSAFKTWKACKKENEALRMLFSEEELELLSEIS